MSSAKVEMEKFDGKGDYMLWKEKLLAHLEMMGLLDGLEEEESAETEGSSTAQTKEATKADKAAKERRGKARSTIILSVGDSVLRKIIKEKSADGLSILAHGYGGSFHLWKNVSSSEESENWQMQKVPSGHFAAVTDVTWARTGEYLLSVSHDQTTRVFSSWKNEEVNEAEDEHWHELARPQVHGHDINCVAMIQDKGNHRFVSGAEEKVERVFEAPLSFLKTLSHTCVGGEGSFPEDLQADVEVLGANMSALGLSQKPLYLRSSSEPVERNGVGEGLDTFETVPEAAPVELKEPPIEDQLAFHTLWPESDKLYGHGNELFSLCCDHKGNLVAKAQSSTMAEIRLWEVGTWKAVGRLQSHTLTVTHLEFSYDDTLLLSVSRDRHFSVFSIQRTENGEVSHKLMAKVEAHKRIIWACSWNPFGHQFATSSWDKMVKI